MKKSKGLSLQVVGAVVVASLFGTSAFAESRHLGGTRGGSHSASRPSSRPSFGRSAPRFESRGFSRPSSRPSPGRSAPRFESRGFSGRSFGPRGSAPRSTPRVTPGWRDSRGPSFGRSTPFRGHNFYNDGHRFYGQGRIERVLPYHGGYRIWLGGWGYPFFVPYRYYDPFRFRLGLFIGFNAFYDPLGYYSVYGWPGYANPPVYSAPYVDRGGDDYSDAVVRGTVQSVDLHTGMVTINDDVSHRQVTALLPPRDRRVDDIRVGDYVEFSGDWVRGRGYDFDADRMERFEPNR